MVILCQLIASIVWCTMSTMFPLNVGIPFRCLDVVGDKLGVAFEVQGPLIEVTRSNCHKVSGYRLWCDGASGLGAVLLSKEYTYLRIRTLGNFQPPNPIT